MFKWGHWFSTHRKFYEKLTFDTPWYAPIRVRIRSSEMLVFQYCIWDHSFSTYVFRKTKIFYPLIRAVSRKGIDFPKNKENYSHLKSRKHKRVQNDVSVVWNAKNRKVLLKGSDIIYKNLVRKIDK